MWGLGLTNFVLQHSDVRLCKGNYSFKELFHQLSLAIYFQIGLMCIDEILASLYNMLALSPGLEVFLPEERILLQRF